MKVLSNISRTCKWSLVITFLGILIIAASASAASKNEIRISNFEDIGSLDPGWFVSEARDYVVMDCVYDGLAKYEEGSWKVVPDLAESWDVSDDHLEVIFHLRKGIQFHKGYGEMTAEDVKFTYDRLFVPGSDATEKKMLTSIDRLEVLDKYTVKMVLKEPMAQLFTLTLPTHTGFIISKKAYQKIGKEKFRLNPVGCGPYEFEQWVPKARTVLKAFKNYWRGKPEVDRIVIVPIADANTAETAIKTGEIDIGYISERSIKSFQKNPKLDVVVKPGLKWYWIGYTFTKPPFDNLKLRQAFRYTVDVEKILHAVFFDSAKRINAMLQSGTLGYWEDAPVYKQDFAKAKQLLKEGGKPDGFKATLNCCNLDWHKTAGEIIKADAAKVGIDLEIHVNELGAFNQANKEGTYNLFTERWSNRMDPHQIMRYFVSDATWNITHWNNAEFSELVFKAASEMDLVKRGEMYVRAQQIQNEECFGVFLTNGVRVWAAQKNVDVGKMYPNGRLTPWTMSFK